MIRHALPHQASHLRKLQWPGIFLLLSIVFFMTCLTGISHAAAKIKVVASTQDLAAIAREIGGDKVEVSAMAMGTQNPHFVPAKPSFILKLKDAQLLVQIGMGMEPWLQPLVDNSRNSRIFRGSPGFVDASQGIPVVGLPVGQADRSMGDVHSAGNPHYWLDPVNAKYISANISNGLKRIDPANAGYYDQQRQAFLKKLAAKITIWMKQAEPLKGKKIITYHDSWPYFAKRFGLSVVSWIEPKPGIPPSPKHIQSLINKAKNDNISIILMEPYFTRSAPDIVAKSTNAKVLVMPPSVNGAPNVITYFDLFDYLLGTMLKAI